MRKFMLAALLAAFSLPALAADLPKMITKGPDIFSFEASGWYFGVEAGAAAAQANVSGQSLFVTSLAKGNLTAAGGTIGGCGGWISGRGGNWWGLHGCVDYQNITGTSAIGTGVASRWSATQEVRFGGNILGWLLDVLPNVGVTGFSFPTFTPPSVNGNVNLAAAPHNYFAVGISEFGMDGSFGGATGAKVGIAPMIKMGAIWQSLDSTGKPNGRAVDIYAQVTFAGKGFTLDNVLAPNGQLAASGSGNLGTQYKAGLGYYFSVPSAGR